MRTLSILTLTALLAAPLAAQGNPADPDKKVAGGGTLPAGWSARLDSPTASMADAKVTSWATGVHVTTGPAVIIWKAADAQTGSFHTLATFTQVKAPTHPEAYGLFVAGKDLNGANQSYLYFIVRGDGKFMIRKRTGATTSIVVDWTANPAVVTQDATSGKATNKLEIDGKVEPTKVSFKVNGTTVHEMPAADVDLTGVVGLRVNHNLDVQIDGFAVHKIK
jgi:hypothetical protein